MKKKLLKSLLIGCLLNISNSAIAGIINFNADKSYFRLDKIETIGFILDGPTKEGEIGLAWLGLDRPDFDNNAFTGQNGRVITSANTSSTSGFTLTTDNSDLFSLESFQSANGYANDDNPVSSLSLIGKLFDGSVITEDFSKTGKIKLSPEWDKLVSVEFIAYGDNNRAFWDSIRYDRFTAPAVVSEPSTIAIFTLCLLGLMTRKFKRKS
tara:strand:- start:332 stop:961 length:630 start_codon:yes stop_codon:yes gene_type:complete